MPATAQITELLRSWSNGDEAAFQALLPIVESELRRLARVYMAKERRDHTLQTTALVNEAYLRLVEARQVAWQDRSHFLGIAARLMRQILVDHARRRAVHKRAAGGLRIPLDEGLAVSAPPEVDLLELDRALDALAVVDRRKMRVIEMRFFGGMTLAETAEALHVSTDTVKRDWRMAKLWLLRELKGLPP